MTIDPYRPPAQEPRPPVVMENRPVFLLVVLLLFFLAGGLMVIGGALGLLRGAPLAAVALQVAIGIGLTGSAYAAWRHYRLGYVGVLVVGLLLAAQKAYAAYSLDGADMPTNLEAALALGILAPFLLHHRFFTRPGGAAA